MGIVDDGMNVLVEGLVSAGFTDAESWALAEVSLKEPGRRRWPAMKPSVTMSEATSLILVFLRLTPVYDMVFGGQRDSADLNNEALWSTVFPRFGRLGGLRTIPDPGFSDMGER